MKDLLEVLIDPENKDSILLCDERGKELLFEQVAIIPYDLADQKKLYAVLKPLDKMNGIEDDEAVVFLVDMDKYGNTVLHIEEDELVAIGVFNKYYDLLEEARAADNKKNTNKPKGDKI